MYTANEPRVYLVYNDLDEDNIFGRYVVAKNREDAKTKVDFAYTYVSFKPHMKFINGKFFDHIGNEVEAEL